MSVPNGLELSLAAGLCETWCTALLNLWDQAAMVPKDKVLIHAGASGVGIAAIQLAPTFGRSSLYYLWITDEIGLLSREALKPAVEITRLGGLFQRTWLAVRCDLGPGGCGLS